MQKKRPRSPQHFAGLPPLVGTSPKILILGSCPSVISDARKQYYGNPQNHFWDLLRSHVYGIPRVNLVDHYAVLCQSLTDAGIALWDSLASCDRQGSSDGSIENTVLNDLTGFLAKYPSINTVAFNGASAAKYGLLHLNEGRKSTERWKVGDTLCFSRSGTKQRVRLVLLPSSSAAHAAMTREAKSAAWGTILRDAGVQN